MITPKTVPDPVVCVQGNPDINAQVHENVRVAGLTIGTNSNKKHIEIKYECVTCGLVLTTKVMPS
jgi:hypothetical protein